MDIGELHLLVVEDDVFQRGLIVNMLRSLGAQDIVEAGDGRQALAQVRAANSKPFDLVICDLNMPEMDGLEFMRHLSAEASHPTVVIASALEARLLSSADRMAKMYGLRLLGTMQKPVTLNYLKEMLAKFDLTEKKWQPAENAQTFTLEEIMQGLRDDQFVPFFQPKVDFKSGRLVGAEALARWEHPTLGLIPPYAFIPLLEKHRQMDELTFAMLQKAAEACREFHANGHLLTISINLSLTSLNEATLADKIIRMVKAAGVDPHYIVLEITESAAMTETGHALENLTRLCMNGFVLSIDDYGTGYSSMQQLTRIAFGELKIDQSFVTEAAHNEALRIVVESSIDMARKLQVKSVAEGVETRQDWEMLKAAGCDTAQGYFISKPLSRAAFAEFMAVYQQQVLGGSTFSQREKLNMLVVDDDDFARGIIVRILRDLGYGRVENTATATAALKLLETQDFDVIVTDVDMPGMNGLEFAHLIRTGKTHAKADTRILVLTAYSDVELLGVAIALDVNGFLVKPIIPAVLENKIALAMSESLKLRPAIAYQSVMTELHNLPGTTKPAAKTQGPAILRNVSTPPPFAGPDGRSVGVQWLRPGMILREDVILKNGNLMMRKGLKLTEPNINRINDIVALLQSSSFVVEESAIGSG